MDPQQQEICVVVVTYNRKELLLRNIRATLSQTHPLDILIFDNHSSDGTKEYLEHNGIIGRSNVHYHYSDKNLGGAGGFSNGMKIAFEMGYSLIWLMDDDGYCYNNRTLGELLAHIPTDCNNFILNSTVICDDIHTLTFGFQDISTYSELIAASQNGVYSSYINPFNGTLVSRACIELIGFPMAEFFLYGDEHEYMLRALKNNVMLGTVVNSLYFHPINRKIETRIVWKYQVPIKNEPIWKTFCDVRNSIYISKKYESPKMVLIRIFIAICAALFQKRKNIRYLQYTILGLIDGIREKFDRPIMFSK